MVKKFLLLLGAVLLFFACGKEAPKTYTVGVVNIVPDLDQTLEGFKSGMAELGYQEGQTIRYLYPGPTTDLKQLPAAVASLVAAKADLILSLTTPATMAAQKTTAALGLPVVFAVVTDPLGAGIVTSIRQPGGNVTGVTFGAQEARRLEWLLKIAPGITQIYVPYNAEDKAPVLALAMVQEAAATLGVHLLPSPFHDQEGLNRAVTRIPAEADALFLLPDSLMGTRLHDMVAQANKRKIPTSVSNVSAVRENDILTSYGFDQYLYGSQAARLADQILKGTNPADLPVETAELRLAINLKAAKIIGLTIPEEILGQANIIVR